MEQNQASNGPLPLEISSKILRMLPLMEKLNARLVCNYWRTILDAFGNFKFRIGIRGNTLVDYLLNSFTGMEYVGLGGVTKTMSSTYSRNKFPQIRTASLGNQNSASAVLSFLKYGLAFAEELYVAEYAFQNFHKSQIVSILKETKWEHLSQLEIMIKTADDKMKLSRKQITMMSFFLEFARIPRLNDFKVNLVHKSNLGDDGSQFQKFCCDLYGFISRHSETLKSVYWSIEAEMLDGFPVSPIPKEVMETMRSNLKLETFAVESPPDHNALTFALSSVCGSDSLTSFIVDALNDLFETIDFLRPELLEEVDQVIQRNRETLTDIHIRALALDMNLLRKCNKLKSLYIGVGDIQSGGGLTNLSALGVKFPELKSFGFFGNVNSENFNFESWMVERMWMVENIQITTLPSFLSVPVLQDLVNRLSQLKEITVEVDLIDLDFQGHELNTYCNDTEGLTFKYDDYSQEDTEIFRSYVIKIAR